MEMIGRLGDIIAVVVVGFIAAGQFLLKTDNYPDDNGVYLDEEVVDYGTPYAYLEIANRGTIKIELNERKAPITVENFKKLADKKKDVYDGDIEAIIIDNRGRMHYSDGLARVTQ